MQRDPSKKKAISSVCFPFLRPSVRPSDLWEEASDNGQDTMKNLSPILCVHPCVWLRIPDGKRNENKEERKE